MRGIIVTLTLVLALFVFGCTGPVQQVNKSTGPTVGNHSPSDNAPPTQTPPSGQPPASNPPDQTAPPSGGDSSGGSDFTGKDYAALVALGLPVQCDITSSYSGKTTTMKVYLKGSAETRVEIPDNSTCKGQIVGITKNNKMYLGCSIGKFMPNCDWLTFNLNVTKPPEGGVAAGGATNPTGAPDLTNVPSTQMNCGPWIYDQSKLETPGKVCDFTTAYGGSGDAYN